MVLELVRRDPMLLGELELSAALDTADDATLAAQLKKAITDVTRVRGTVEYRGMREWAREIDRVLDRISVLLERRRASLVLELLEHFFARMDEALAKLMIPMAVEELATRGPAQFTLRLASSRSLSLSSWRGRCSSAKSTPTGISSLAQVRPIQTSSARPGLQNIADSQPRHGRR